MSGTSQMTAGEARVIDPVLSTAARGYKNSRFIFPDIFPMVTVMQRGGKIIGFGTEDFEERDLKRAPGGRVAEMDIGYEADDYTCQQQSLNGKVPIEHIQEAGAVPGIDLAMVAVDKVMRSVFLQIEIAAAARITPANFVGRTEALAGTAQWSHNDSRPAKAVREKFSAIRKGIGIKPNGLFVGDKVNDYLVNHPDVVDRIKHTQPAIGDAIDDDALARYFRVEKYCVGAAQKGRKGAFTDIWDNIALLCYSNVTSLAEQGSPSFGYTYQLNGYPMVEAPWYDRDYKSWKYPVTTEDTPVIAGIEAAFLWTNVVDDDE